MKGILDCVMLFGRGRRVFFFDVIVKDGKGVGD
jgi:hypothetical protein